MASDNPKCSRCGSALSLGGTVCLRCGEVFSDSWPEAASPEPRYDQENEKGVKTHDTSAAHTTQSDSPQGRPKAPDSRRNRDDFWSQNGPGRPLAFWCVVAFFIVIAFIAEESQKSGRHTPALDVVKDQNDRQEATSTRPGSGSSRSSAEYRGTEVVPPVGDNRILNRSQIRYCLAQGKRLLGMESVIDSRSNREIDFFNRKISDYNARCSSYRYYESDFTAARRLVDSAEDQLLNEGRRSLWDFRLAGDSGQRSTQGMRQGGGSSTDTREIAQAKRSQRILRDLGYYHGEVDGIVGPETRTAIKLFQSDYGLEADGDLDEDTYRQLLALRLR